MEEKAQLFSQEWREIHARGGDAALDQAIEELLANPGEGRSIELALIAQAHYLAANVRAKIQEAPLQPPPHTTRTKTSTSEPLEVVADGAVAFAGEG